MIIITSVKQQKSKKEWVNVYLDESGINRKSGASVYCLTIIDSKISQELNEQILQIEKNLKIKPFHWREQDWKIKSKFLKKIIKIDGWNCIIIVINNKNFSQVLLTDFMAKALQGFEIRCFYFDGKKSKAYRNSVKRSFKNLGIKISSLKFVGNKSHAGIRLADAVAGLSRLHYDAKSKMEADSFFKLFLRNKISAQILNGYRLVILPTTRAIGSTKC